MIKVFYQSFSQQLSVHPLWSGHAWLLFFQISSQAIDKDVTQNAAFAAWKACVSAETLRELRKIVRFFSIFITPLKLAKPIYLGGDGKRMLSAMEFLSSNLKNRQKHERD